MTGDREGARCLRNRPAKGLERIKPRRPRCRAEIPPASLATEIFVHMPLARLGWEAGRDADALVKGAAAAGLGLARGGPRCRSMDSALQVAEEEVVESCGPSSKFEDIYRLLSEGCFPPSFCSIKRKNLRRYAQKFVVEGEAGRLPPRRPAGTPRLCGGKQLQDASAATERLGHGGGGGGVWLWANEWGAEVRPWLFFLLAPGHSQALLPLLPSALTWSASRGCRQRWRVLCTGAGGAAGGSRSRAESRRPRPLLPAREQRLRVSLAAHLRAGAGSARPAWEPTGWGAAASTARVGPWVPGAGWEEERSLASWHRGWAPQEGSRGIPG